MDEPPEERLAINAIPRSRRRQWVAAALVLVILGWLGWSAYSVHFADPFVIASYLFSPPILAGLVATIILAVLAEGTGIILGVAFALMRQTHNTVLQAVSSFYIWFFRGTPVLVQLLFWFNGVPLVFKQLSLGLPGTDLTVFSIPMVDFLTPLLAAWIGLGLNEGAYMAEIVRSGLLAVDPGQLEAARALGLRPGQVTRRILLPQALRVIVPPTGNNFISMLKTTSLAYVVTYGELLRRATDIYSTNFDVIDLLIVICIWYLLLTTALSIGQHYLEMRVGRGFRTRGSRTASRGTRVLDRLRSTLKRPELRPDPSRDPSHD